MNSNKKILDIMQEAKDSKWPLAKTFIQLKASGVISYRTTWANGYKTFFKLENDIVPQHDLDGFEQPYIYCIFSKSQAKKALQLHQQGATSYLEWLYEMSDAGISEYIVNMLDNTVTYYSLERTDSFVEAIPFY